MKKKNLNVVRKYFAFFMAMMMIAGSSLFVLPTTEVKAATQATYYVSPTGSDANPGTLALPFLTLARARDVVRTINSNMTGDIIVNLRASTYALPSTLDLAAADSGTNGFNVIYQNYTGEVPIISGGITVTGWTLFDAVKNIYRANVGTSLDTRQLYVNGVRAVRARSVDGTGWTKNGNGFDMPAAVASWGNITNVEVVGRKEWKEFHGGIASAAGTHVVMKQPFWNNSQLHTGVKFDTVEWIENAYELLDVEREWYLNKLTGYLYYKPSAAENMSTATIVAPKLEKLINGTSVNHVQFKGLKFSYATWLRPNTNDGYVDAQAGSLVIGTPPDFETSRETWEPTDANVRFDYSSFIWFEGNTFEHLGAGGLWLGRGSKNNTVFNNTFQDISAYGIQVGHIQDHHANAADLVKDNLIDNNLVTDVAAELHSNVGIMVGYTDSTVVSHNEVFNVPYTGISFGWGWGLYDIESVYYPTLWKGYTTPTVLKNNIISNNYVYDFMKELKDGGGIYHIGADPGGKIIGNLISGKGPFAGGSIYADQGTRFLEVAYNGTYNTYGFVFKGDDYSIHENSDFNANTTDVNIPSYIKDNAGRNGYLTSLVQPITDISTVTASSVFSTVYSARDATDGITGVWDSGEWASLGELNPWIQINLYGSKRINKIVLYDRPNLTDNANSGTLSFSDGSSIAVTGIPTNGTAKEITFTDKVVSWARFTVTGGNGSNVGLSEVQLFETTGNYARDAIYKTSSSSQFSNNSGAKYAVNGKIGLDGSGEWASNGELNPWEKLAWFNIITINKVVLFDRPNATINANGGTLTFSDGSSIAVTGIPADGTAKEITFANKAVTWVKFQVSGGTGTNVGLSEIQVYGPAGFPPVTPTPTPAPVDLALNKTATASSIFGTGFETAKAVDGNGTTRWASLANGLPAWFKVDMGSIQSIGQVIIDWEAAYAVNYSLSVSNDNITYTTVKSVTGASGGTTDDLFTLQTARYVKIDMTANAAPNQLYSLWRFSVYAPQDHALYQFSTAGSTYGTGYEASKAVDGNGATRWASASNVIPTWYKVDLGSMQNIGNVVIDWEAAYAVDYSIQVSNDDNVYTTVKTVVGASGGTTNDTFLPVNATYVKIEMTKRTANPLFSIWRLAVFATTDIAVNKTATAGSTNGSGNYVAANAVDENPATRWASASNVIPTWLKVDLGSIRGVGLVEIVWEAAYAVNYSISVSSDDLTYTTVKTVTGATGATTSDSFTAVNARYVKVDMTVTTANPLFSLWRYSVYGN